MRMNSSNNSYNNIINNNENNLVASGSAENLFSDSLKTTYGSTSTLKMNKSVYS